MLGLLFLLWLLLLWLLLLWLLLLGLLLGLGLFGLLFKKLRSVCHLPIYILTDLIDLLSHTPSFFMSCKKQSINYLILFGTIKYGTIKYVN
jgi:hypothetical protein